MDAVLAEDGSAARGHPDSCQCVAVDLVLLDHSLAFLMLKHKRRVSRLILPTRARFLFYFLKQEKIWPVLLREELHFNQKKRSAFTT